LNYERAPSAGSIPSALLLADNLGFDRLVIAAAALLPKMLTIAVGLPIFLLNSSWLNE
jgi:hypothetical protein